MSANQSAIAAWLQDKENELNTATAMIHNSLDPNLVEVIKLKAINAAVPFKRRFFNNSPVQDYYDSILREINNLPSQTHGVYFQTLEKELTSFLHNYKPNTIIRKQLNEAILWVNKQMEDISYSNEETQQALIDEKPRNAQKLLLIHYLQSQRLFPNNTQDWKPIAEFIVFLTGENLDNTRKKYLPYIEKYKTRENLEVVRKQFDRIGQTEILRLIDQDLKKCKK